MNSDLLIGPRIRAARLAAGLSLAEVAAAAKVTPDALKAIEDGGRINALQFLWICNEFGFDDRELLGMPPAVPGLPRVFVERCWDAHGLAAIALRVDESLRTQPAYTEEELQADLATAVEGDTIAEDQAARWLREALEAKS